MENNEFYATVIPSSVTCWQKYGDRLLEIERAVFGSDAFEDAMMQDDINNPETILVILQKDTAIVGFTYAMPENKETARIVNTAILEQYQGRGLVKTLMEPLETELRNDGFKFITRDAMVKNGYAKKIAKSYKERIIETEKFEGAYGKQQHFKISL